MGMILVSSFFIFTHLFIFIVFSEQKCMLCFGFRYIRQVGLFWLQQILRVPHSNVLPDPISVFYVTVFTFILLLARPFLQFAQTFTVWDSKPNTSFLKRNLYDISVNRVNFLTMSSISIRKRKRKRGVGGPVRKRERNLVSTGPKVMKFMQNK